METYIRQRQLIISPLIPSRVIGENEPLTAVFNKVIATQEVKHKGQGRRPAPWFRRRLPPRLFSPRRFTARPVRDPEAPPRGPHPGQEGLPPPCGPQHGYREENGLPGDHPPRWRSGPRPPPLAPFETLKRGVAACCCRRREERLLRHVAARRVRPRQEEDAEKRGGHTERARRRREPDGGTSRPAGRPTPSRADGGAVLLSSCRKPYFLEPATRGSPSTSRSFTTR